MKKSTTKLIALTLALTSAMSLVACTSNDTPAPSSTTPTTSSSTTTEPTTEPVTLRFSWWGGESRHEATIAAAELYMEENEHVTIELEYSGWDGYKDKLVTQLAGGTAADIMQVNYDWIHDLRAQDQYFVDPRTMPEIIDMSGFSESAFSGCWVGDELQGLPTGLSVTTLIVNKNVLDAHGLDSSDSTFWNWDNVIEEGKKINDANPSHYLLNEFPDGSSLVEMLLAQKGKELVNADYTIGVTEEELIEELNLLKSLIDNNIMLPYEESSIYAAQTEQFPKWLNDEMGIFIQVASVIPSFADMNLDVMMVPMYEDAVSSGANIYPTNIISINAKGENIEEAAKFVNFFYNDEESIKALKDVRGVPATSHGREILDELGLQNPLITKAVALGEEYPGLPIHPAKFNSEINKTIGEYIERFGYGEASAEDTAKDLLAELEEICAELR